MCLLSCVCMEVLGCFLTVKGGDNGACRIFYELIQPGRIYFWALGRCHVNTEMHFYSVGGEMSLCRYFEIWSFSCMSLLFHVVVVLLVLLLVAFFAGKIVLVGFASCSSRGSCAVVAS